MKTILRAILTSFSLLLIHTAFSAVISPIVHNGDWANPSTWNHGRIPSDQDVVIIPDGMTVIISTNLYQSVPRQPDLIINVFGILQMTGAGQINIGCGSQICVYGSGIVSATGCNCNQINIGAQGPDWKGMFNSTLTGGQCITGNCFLPVTLTSFSGSTEGDKVNLSWSSSEEINFEYYGIERSADGFFFESIGMVNGKSDGGNAGIYSFSDQNSLNGLNYYRLKMVDIDGSFSWSKIISVYRNPSIELNIYPNPVNSGEKILLSLGNEYAGDLSVTVRDLNGKVCFQQSYISPDVLSTGLTLDLKTGIYLVHVQGVSYSVSSRLVVK